MHTCVHTHKNSERIRGHAQLEGEHKALEELFRQLGDLLRKDLTDEGDELVVLVTQRRELQHRHRDCINISSHQMWFLE